MGAFTWDDSRGGLTAEIQEPLAMFTPSKEEECGIKGFQRPARESHMAAPPPTCGSSYKRHGK